MSKYIIKSCPCYNNERFLGGFLGDEDTLCTYYGEDCQYCTDCVMKQIVKECTNSLRFSCERILAEKLLGLLDIQEVE